jgi:WD40 repeat protein/DNA-directed RNA polymerase subunit RPC12/RpoP
MTSFRRQSVLDAPCPEWIDEIADRFEAAWAGEARPDIARFLGNEQGVRRRALLEELIGIDLEYRCRAGPAPSLAEYVHDFPELREPDGTPPERLLRHAERLRERLRENSAESTASASTMEGGRVRCPQCGTHIGALAAGRAVVCPSCGGSFRVEAASATPSASELPRRLGRFQLVELVGSGSFGAVYRAHDLELDRQVAVKLPRAGAFASRGEEERFLREAKSAGRLVHPNIVQIHDVAYAGDMPFIVSDFVAGRTLADLERRLSFRESAELLAQLSEALAFAHERKIIHRDIKPRNILIDSSGKPLIADFGLARRDEGETVVTLDGQVIGTPTYMAPEQAAGKVSDVDGRSDLYALGVVLYQLLTGELPFRGTIDRVLHQVLHDDPRPPRRLNSRIPRDLETICLKAMEKAPGARYQSGVDLAADLRRWLGGEPIAARPVGRFGRLWRWSCRKPVTAGLAAAVASLMVTVTVVAVVVAVQRDRVAQLERGRLEDAERRLGLVQKVTSTESQARVARGLFLLEGGNSLGLLDLLAARQQVEDIPERRDSWSVLWSGWHGACSGRLVQVLGHDGAPVDRAIFSPNGQFVLTLARDGSTRLWETKSGHSHGQMLIRPRNQAYAPQFTAGGSRLAFIGMDYTVRFYDTASLRPVAGSPAMPVGDTAVAVSRDERWMATCSGPRNDQVQIWDLATGRAHGKPIVLMNPAPSGGLAFSPDGRWLAALQQGGPSQLWETATGRPHGRPMGIYDQRGGGALPCLTFRPDGARVAMADGHHGAQLWDTETGLAAGPPLQHPEDVHAIAFSPDGKLLATACFDGRIRFWDATNGAPLETPLRHDGPVYAVAFSPDSRLLATASFDTTARLWDVASRQPCAVPFRHQGIVRSVAFSADGQLLATASQDGTARVWKVKADEPVILRHPDRVWAVAFTPDGKRLVTASQDGRARFWNTATGEMPLGPLVHGHEALSVAVDPHGRWFATEGGQTVRLWDVAGRSRTLHLPNGSGGRPVAFSPDGKLLCVGGSWLVRQVPRQVRGLCLFDVATGQQHGEPFGPELSVYALAFSPRGDLIASFPELPAGDAARGCLVDLWETATGRLYGQLKHGGLVEAVAFSPDDRLLATASREMTVRLWDRPAGQPHGTPFQQQAFVQGLAFSPNGKMLATVAADGNARILDVASGLRCGPVMHHQGVGTAVAFSPDGTLLATASFDQTARIWRVPRLLTDLREMELRTWVALGARLNEQGFPEVIPWQEWQRLRNELANLERSGR